jgi:hypothetical protein
VVEEMEASNIASQIIELSDLTGALRGEVRFASGTDCRLAARRYTARVTG